MPTYKVVKGTSKPQTIQLSSDGVPFVGTGIAVDLEFSANFVNAQTDAVSVAWLSQADGTVQLSNLENLPIGVYEFRFTVTDGGGKKEYIPNFESVPNILKIMRV